MEKLNEIFDLPQTAPVETPKQEIIEAIPVPDKSSNRDADDDYELARRTLRSVITKGSTALDDVISLARSSEHPRSYEVAGQIMKTMAEVSKDLLSLQKQKQDIDKPPPNTMAPTIEQQNNIVVAGSTEDIIKMIKNKQQQNDSSNN